MVVVAAAVTRSRVRIDWRWVCLCVLNEIGGVPSLMHHKQHHAFADPRDRGPQGRASPQHPDFGRGHGGGGAGGGNRVAVSRWLTEGGKAGVWVGGL